ncbi:hypothetical protein CHS0354_038898 [Potamilus streckersoni]|uniref:Luciferin 4-monooxygenase n=1 Tax=Potamilus streckersoni TaxID=2493646 RepID=A0AAE0SRT3_9BIVA|nr:hypothetical protein CHS0354_038898 [Potamilus streckersoni]
MMEISKRQVFRVLVSSYLQKSPKSVQEKQWFQIHQRTWVQNNHWFSSSIFVQPQTKVIHCKNLRSICIRRSSFLSSRPLVLSDENGVPIIRSPYLDVEVPSVSFSEFVFSKLDEYKGVTCMVDHVTGRSYTCSELKECAIKVASALTKLGLRKGNALLVFMSNCPEYAMVFLACGVMGVTVSTANPVYTPMEIQKQLEHSEATIIVTMSTMVEIVREAIKFNKTLYNKVKEIIVVGKAEACRPFSTLLEDDGSAFPDNVDICPKEDIIALPYSSGTTGLPKGVMLTHSNLVANLLQLCRGPMQLRPREDTLIGLLPFYHIYGMVVVQFGPIIQGAKLVILPKFEPHVFLSAIQQHQITYMHLVPPLALFLAKSPLVSNFKVNSVKTIVCGAAPLGEGVTNDVKNRIGAELCQAYGLTETSPLVSYDISPAKVGTVGRMAPSTEVMLIDPLTGNPVPPEKEGELLVRGPQVMKGYLKNSEATNNTIRDGWLQTGDLAKYDLEGYIKILDRLKELIKYKGYQIAPAELEAILCTHPAVEDAAVMGIRAGEEVGEIPQAFVVCKKNIGVKEEELVAYVSENVAPYKKIRGGIKFVDQIPKTASGKILRRLLKE